MSTRRPEWWPAYGDPVRCPMTGMMCVLFDCVMGEGTCEKRNALALVPIEPRKEKSE